MTRPRKVDRYFVRGQKLAFPYATKALAGPFDAWIDAWKAREQMAPEHPGINLSVIRRRVEV